MKYSRQYMVAFIIVLSIPFFSSCFIENLGYSLGKCEALENNGKAVFRGSECNYNITPSCISSDFDHGCYYVGGDDPYKQSCATCMYQDNPPQLYTPSNDQKNIVSSSSDDVESDPVYYFDGSSFENLVSSNGSTLTTGSIGNEIFNGWYEKIINASASGKHSTSNAGSRTIFPIGNSQSELKEGAILCWFLINTPTSINKQYSSSSISFFQENNNFQIIFSTENGSDIVMKINLLGNNIVTKNVGSIAGWHKLYIVWGDDLKDGYDLILFIDNAEIAAIDNDTLPDFIGTNTFSFTISESVIARGKRKCKDYIIYEDCHNITYTTYSQASLKEIKIWDRAYSLDPQSVY